MEINRFILSRSNHDLRKCTGVVASIVGGAFVSGLSNMIANRTQRDIATDTNQANRDMLHEQMAYQTGERIAAQEYNEPVAQKQRYEQAGINPYLAMGNINSGVTSAQTSPSASPMVGYDYRSPIEGMSDNISKLVESLGMDSKFKGIQLDNEAKLFNNQMQATRLYYDLMEQKSRIYNMDIDSSEKQAQIKSINKQMEYLQKQMDFFDETIPEQKRKIKAENDLTEAKVEYQQKENAAFNALNDLQKRRIKADIAQAFSVVGLNKSSADFVDAQQRTEVIKRLGIKLDNALKSGEITLQSLGMNEAELESMRKGKILHGKRSSKFCDFVDFMLNSPREYILNGFLK